MKCRFPVQIECKGRQIYVPCGKCAWCLSLLRDQWVFRLKQEAKEHLWNYFVTLTYRDEDLPWIVNDETGEMVNSVNKQHISDFNRDLRKKGFKFRFFVTSEYGPKTLRPHYHGIYFCDQPMDLEKSWPHGDNNVQLPANDGSYQYVTKYVLKGSQIPEGAAPNFRLMSRRPGIGSRFNYKGDDYLITPGGIKIAAPRYYRKGYINSLNEKLRAEIQDAKLDYLAGVDQHSRLRQVYEEKKIDMPFEDWLWIQYGKDLVQQKRITNSEDECI